MIQSQHSMNRRGFTLIELIIVMIIMGILATVTSVSTVNMIRGLRLNHAVKTLVQDINYARSMANVTGKYHYIDLEVNPVNRYRLYKVVNMVPSPAEDPAKPGQPFPFVNLSSDLQTAIYSASVSKIYFTPAGRWYDGNMQPLLSEIQIQLCGYPINGNPAGLKTIRLNPLTGLIKVDGS